MVSCPDRFEIAQAINGHRNNAVVEKQMTKTTLVKTLSAELSLSRKTISMLLSVLADVAVFELRAKGSFKLLGLGRLMTKQRPIRIPRQINAPPLARRTRTVIIFRGSKVLKDSVQ